MLPTYGLCIFHADTAMRLRLIPYAVALTLVLAACQREPAPAAPVVDAATVAKRAALDTLGEADLHAAASKAIREQRIYSPAGDNAIEMYVALVRRFPNDDAAKIALLELQPYAVIATEQSLQRDDLKEAARLIALIHDADPEASALPRLRDERLRREQGLASAAATAVAASETVAPPVAVAATVPASSPPVATPPPAPIVAAPVEKPVPVATPTPVLASLASTAPSPAAVASSVPTRQPSLVRDVAPRYPSLALRRGIEGNVELAFTIGPDGAVSDARVVRGSPAGLFDEAALAVTRQWKFEATGQSVPGRRTIAFNLPKPAP